MTTRDSVVDELMAKFSYDAAAGRVLRADGGDAVRVKHRKGKPYCAVVSHRSRSMLASTVIYALENGVMPNGLRTRFADGDSTNLRRANLTFCVADCSQKGEPRTLSKLLLAMARLGGRASTPRLRAATGISIKVPLASYMKLLEAKGQAHVCGLDEEHTQATGKPTLMWALGPGQARPADARAVATEMRRRRLVVNEQLEEIRDERRSKALARISVAAARSGATPNSIFSMAAQLI